MENTVDYYNGHVVTPFIEALLDWIDDTSSHVSEMVAH
jgi:hypothetical protein